MSPFYTSESTQLESFIVLDGGAAPKAKGDDTVRYIDVDDLPASMVWMCVRAPNVVKSRPALESEFTESS